MASMFGLNRSWKFIAAINRLHGRFARFLSCRKVLLIGFESARSRPVADVEHGSHLVAGDGYEDRASFAARLVERLQTREIEAPGGLRRALAALS
jgi:hypothetical protein